MSQKNQGNPQSKAGMAKGTDRGQAKTVNRDMVGSSDGNGIRFPLHNHPDKSNVRSPEKG